MQKRTGTIAVALATLTAAALIAGAAAKAQAGGLVCRKVVAPTASGEAKNALNATRARCADDEMLTGGACYAEVRPEDDGSCQTSATGIIQALADSPNSTRGAFYTCLQTGGSNCAVEERTRAMAICCKIEGDDKSADAKSSDTEPAKGQKGAH